MINKSKIRICNGQREMLKREWLLLVCKLLGWINYFITIGRYFKVVSIGLDRI